MSVHNSASAAVPSCEQNTTVTTFMLDILEAIDQIGDATKTEASAYNSSPSTARVVSKSSSCQSLCLQLTVWFVRTCIRFLLMFFDHMMGSPQAPMLHLDYEGG